MRTRRLVTLLAAIAMVMGLMGPAWASDMSQKIGAGWGCADAVGLPAGHCVNPAVTKKFLAGNPPQTFQLLVFDANGDFVTSEIATFKTSADSRACPHDNDELNLDNDGTYWAFIPDVLYVCHHRPEG